MPAGATRTRMTMQNFHRPITTVAGFAGHLGRRGAPAGIGAYYQNLPYKQIGIGYYDAVGVTANSFNVTSPSDQELLNLLQSQQPIGAYVPWAERTADREWVEVEPTTERHLFVVTQEQLDQIQSTTGEPVTTVAILSPAALSATQIEAAFDQSRYEWLKTEGVYAQNDPNETPTIIFLHWGRLRSFDDLKGRDADEVFLSQALSGQLTFPVEVPIENDRDLPNATFIDALNSQFPPDQVRTVLVSQQEQVADVYDSRVSMVKTLLLIGAAGGAGYLLYRWLR